MKKTPTQRSLRISSRVDEAPEEAGVPERLTKLNGAHHSQSVSMKERHPAAALVVSLAISSAMVVSAAPSAAIAETRADSQAAEATRVQLDEQQSDRTSDSDTAPVSVDEKVEQQQAGQANEQEVSQAGQQEELQEVQGTQAEKQKGTAEETVSTRSVIERASLPRAPQAKYTLVNTGQSAKDVYTGHSAEYRGFTTTGLQPGHTLTVLSYRLEGTDAGTHTGTFFGTPVIVDADGNDVTASYDITNIPGAFTIEPADISNSGTPEGGTPRFNVEYPANVTYDGTEHKLKPIIADARAGFRGSPKTMVEGVDYELSYSGDLVNPGRVWVTITGKGNYTNQTKACYDILPVSIQDTRFKLTAPADVTYNGAVQQGKPVLVDSQTGTTLKEGTDYTLSYDRSPIDAGTVTVTVTGQGLYGGTLTTSYQINKAPLKVTTESGARDYDGTDLTAPGLLEGMQNGDGQLKVTGTQKDVGSSTNTYTIEWVDAAKEGNYRVEEVLGTLTVIPADISEPSLPSGATHRFAIEAPADVTYTGSVQAGKPIIRNSVTGIVLKEGVDYTLAYAQDGVEKDRVAIDSGMVTVTATGMGNYTGALQTAYKILPGDVKPTPSSNGSKEEGAQPEVADSSQNPNTGDEPSAPFLALFGSLGLALASLGAALGLNRRRDEESTDETNGHPLA